MLVVLSEVVVVDSDVVVVVSDVVVVLIWVAVVLEDIEDDGVNSDGFGHVPGW